MRSRRNQSIMVTYADVLTVLAVIAAGVYVALLLIWILYLAHWF